MNKAKGKVQGMKEKRTWMWCEVCERTARTNPCALKNHPVRLTEEQPTPEKVLEWRKPITKVIQWSWTNWHQTDTQNTKRARDLFRAQLHWAICGYLGTNGERSLHVSGRTHRQYEKDQANGKGKATENTVDYLGDIRRTADLINEEIEFVEDRLDIGPKTGGPDAFESIIDDIASHIQTIPAASGWSRALAEARSHKSRGCTRRQQMTDKKETCKLEDCPTARAIWSEYGTLGVEMMSLTEAQSLRRNRCVSEL
jgi:hypothetical protein